MAAQKCDLYLPGHEVHWIQARKSSEVTPSTGTLVNVVDGVISVQYLDRLAYYRHHRAERVLKIAKLGCRPCRGSGAAQSQALLHCPR